MASPRDDGARAGRAASPGGVGKRTIFGGLRRGTAWFAPAQLRLFPREEIARSGDLIGGLDGPRRLWSADLKRRIVAESFEPGASVAVVARRHGVNANLLFT